ncbi:hypothetical protein MOQ_003743 [Trypanosoma cruzi marinkellei]|uniref:Ataxin-10 domain-containing protein n=1 Tax=Trypanosoma cruzi marinkellei TaxID=85056 RepID=K2NTV9_TRYCR|nr:hypothetical protein MOQ_003743 [Trypanosoma cruzi marinkellei]
MKEVDTARVLSELVDALQRVNTQPRWNTVQELRAITFKLEDLFSTPNSVLASAATEDDAPAHGGNASEMNSPDIAAASFDNSGAGDGLGETATPLAPLREMSDHFGKNKPYAEEGLQDVFTMLQRLIDGTHSTAGCAALACMGQEIDKMITLMKPVALVDMRAAVYMNSLCSNIAAAKESRMQLHTALMWDFVKNTVQTYITDHPVLYTALVAISNLSYLKDLKLTREDCGMLSRLIYPVYTEVHLVEVWAAMICNLTAHHPETVQVFLEIGVVEVLERLVLYFGEEGRTVIRCLQSLSNLSMGFITGHPPVLVE